MQDVSAEFGILHSVQLLVLGQGAGSVWLPLSYQVLSMYMSETMFSGTS